jgi:uncharacterized protein involved in exopolysaccharide biosynthesis
MSDHTALQLSPPNIVRLAWRHKGKIVFVPLATLALGVLVFLYAPRTYRSEARLFLRVGRESVGLDPAATTGQTIPLTQSSRKDEVKSAVEVLKSRSIIAKAVDAVGPSVVLGKSELVSEGGERSNFFTDSLNRLVQLIKSVDPISEREEAIVYVTRHLYAGAERESNVIVVEYDSDTPQLARTVCEAIVSAYQQEHMRIFRNDESRPFFADQQERLQRQLDDSLAALRTVKNELGLSSIDERRTTLEAQFNAVELDRLSTEQQLATANGRISALEEQLAKLPERLVASKKSIPNQGADLLRQQLYSLEVNAMDLQARYSDSHPLVKAAKEQLEAAKKVMAQQSDERMETTDNINPIHRDLELDLKQQTSIVAGLDKRHESLTKQKDAVLAELRVLNDSDLTIDQLHRQADLARDKYFQYARKMEEARIDKELENEEISNISILQPATLQEKPVSPSKLLLALGTMFLAVAGTFSLVVVSEWWSLSVGQVVQGTNGHASRHIRPGGLVHRRALAPSNGGPPAGTHAASRI